MVKKVGIGSKNETKIKGVIEGYKAFGLEVEVIPIEVSSGVSKQPKSLEETVRGAFNRALNTMNILKDQVDETVGIESGIVRIGTLNKYVDITVAVILDRNGNLSLGLSPAFEIPLTYIHEMFSQEIELETIAERVSKIERIGEKGGFIQFLSEGKISREDLVKLAVIMALIPRYSPIKSTYGFY